MNITLKKYILLLIIFVSVTANATDSITNNVIKLMGGAGYPPYEFINDEGKPDGFNVEVMTAVMNMTGKKYVLELGNWKDVISNVETGKIDGVIGITYTSKRAELVKYSFTECLVHQVIVVKDNSDIYSMDDISDKVVCVQNGGLAHEYVTQYAKSIKLLTAGSYLAVMQMLMNDKCDAIICSEETAKYMKEKMNLTGIRIIESAITPSEYGPAVVWGRDSLLSEINAALYKLEKSGELEKIKNKWFNGFDKDKYVHKVNLMLISIIVLFLILLFILLSMRQRKNAKILERMYLDNKTVLRSMPIGVIIYDKEGKMIFMNPAIKGIFGVRDNTEKSINHLSLYDDPCVSDEMKEYVSKGELFSKEIVYNLEIATKNAYFKSSKQGKLYLHIESSVIRAKNGNVDKYIIFLQDKTENYKSDSKLRQSELNLRLALETGKVNVWYQNMDDERFYNIYGNNFIEDGDSYDKILKILHDDSKIEFEKHYKDVVSGKDVDSSMTLRLILKRDGRDIYVENHLMAVYNKEEELTRIMGTIKDISDEYYYHKDIEHSKRCQDLAIQTNGLLQWNYDCDTQEFSSISNGAGKVSELFGVDGYLSVSHPNDLDRMQVIYNRMLNREDFEFNFEARIKGEEEQEWSYVLLNGVAIKDEKDKVISYIGFVKDNTKWRKLNIMLIDKNVQLNMALEAGNIIPLMWDISNNKIVITSSEMKEKYGIFDSTTDGMTIDMVLQNIHPDDRDIISKQLKELLSGETNHITAEVRYDINGEYNDYFEVNMLSEVINVNSKEMRVVGYMQNITERKTMFNDLQRAKDIADQSNKLKSTFLANMSHEIRTPLNAIVGFSEMLMDTNNEDEKKEYYDIISLNNELLLRLISDVLDLSKIESGMIDLKITEFDVTELFMQIYNSMTRRVNSEKVQLICANKYKSCRVHLDPERLSQVLINFLTNAIKFTPEGYIKMEYDVVEGGIMVKVTDTGIGISEDKLEKVFDRFYKINSFAQGTGLGMAICKAIVEAEHGKIGVESELGKGSTFWAFMPTDVNVKNIGIEDVTAEELNMQEVSDYASVSKEKQPLETGNERINSKLRILVAEDNDSNFELLSAILKGNNTLHHARNGAEVVDMQSKAEYDVILMDVNMPVMNGLDATREIRKVNVRVPIIAVTANAFDSDKKVAIEAGCTSFLAKPIKKQQLINAINQALAIGK